MAMEILGSVIQHGIPNNPWPAIAGLALLAVLATFRYWYRLWVIHDLVRERSQDRVMLKGGRWRFVIEITPTQPKEPPTGSYNVIPLRTPRHNAPGPSRRRSDDRDRETIEPPT
jgi:hypothetical protein